MDENETNDEFMLRILCTGKVGNVRRVMAAAERALKIWEHRHCGASWYHDLDCAMRGYHGE